MVRKLKSGSDHVQVESGTKSHLIVRGRLLSRVLALASLLFPLLSTVGWTLGIPLLTRGHPALPAMQPNTIFGLILSAIALLFFQETNKLSMRNVAAFFMAAIVATLRKQGIIVETSSEHDPAIALRKTDAKVAELGLSR